MFDKRCQNNWGLLFQHSTILHEAESYIQLELTTFKNTSLSDFDPEIEHPKADGFIESRLKTCIQSMHELSNISPILVDPCSPYEDGLNSVYVITLP